VKLDLKAFLEQQALRERTALKVNEERLAYLAHLEVLAYPVLKVMKENKETTESQYIFIHII